jgi:acetyl esterase/lipase
MNPRAIFPSYSRTRRQLRAAHGAVVVMSGGGYTHEVMEQEGAYEARWLAAYGVAAFVLEYRLSRGLPERLAT